MHRRDFLKTSLAATAAVGFPRALTAFSGASVAPRAKADAMILIWLPGGIAQADAWDPKHHTPFTPGMRGSDLLGTCPIIPTTADGISFGAGLENLASVMDKGMVLRSLTNDATFGAVHLKAQHHMMTGFPFPSGVMTPSIGAVVARTLGRRDSNLPAYIAIGRDANSARLESAFINTYQGPGFYGPRYAPLVIPDAARGLSALHADPTDNSRTVLDSRAKRALELSAESGETLKHYGVGDRFARGCLLARRLVEAGARFVQVEYPYEAFGGFDAHEHGARRTAEMKRRIDSPVAQLIRDLDERGMLKRTLVVVASEFGRTIAAGDCASGEQLTIHDVAQYGFHGHFNSCNSMLFFGGGFKQGFAYGKTADRHPMVAVENPVRLEDVHATIYAALGIAPHAYYVHDGTPICVTNGGNPISALLA